MNITQEDLRALLSYDQSTGVFRWKIRAASHLPAGAIAGTKTDKGYIVVIVRGVRYRAHRLAWFYVYGEWPARELDHIDHNRSNNSISNLRLATRSQQMFNVRHKSNKHSARGVVCVNHRWVAKIRHNGTRLYLGCFPTKEIAANAYRLKAIELYGDFVPAWAR